MLTIIAATAESVSSCVRMKADRVSGTGISDSRLQHWLQTFFATRRNLSGRNGKRFPSPGYAERRPQTQNKKRKSHYEKSKHSVKTNSRTSDPTAPRLPCGSVFLGTQSRVSPRRVPFNGTVSGYVDSQSGTECEPSIHVINFGHANQLGAFTGTAEFSRALANPIRIFVKIIFPTLAPLTGLRPTATKSPALSRGTCARQKRRECTTTMKPRR